MRGRGGRGNQVGADLILGKDQLYDMFQQILCIKKFEHQLIYNALLVRASPSSLLLSGRRGKGSLPAGQPRRAGGSHPAGV